jgi:cobalt/nickel transport system ATP-binding protein
MPEFLLEFDRIYYTYPGATKSAIDGLMLRIPQGKRIALIGQNGCGKTTLFLLANGLYKPQQGKIFWRGKALQYDRHSLMQLRQQIGLVFQNPEQQLVATTVEEDISYGLCNLGLPLDEIAQRVEQILAEFDLIDLATTPIHHLSLGQKKRVSLADVMVLQPELLLLDEPTAYLDQIHSRQLMSLLKTIHGNGTTIMMATHDLELVYRWADWVFALERGKLMFEGTPEDVFSQLEQRSSLQFEVPIAFNILALLNEIEQAQIIDTQEGTFKIAITQIIAKIRQRLSHL